MQTEATSLTTHGERPSMLEMVVGNRRYDRVRVDGGIKVKKSTLNVSKHLSILPFLIYYINTT
jgi:hypothetical protein